VLSFDLLCQLVCCCLQRCDEARHFRAGPAEAARQQQRLTVEEHACRATAAAAAAISKLESHPLVCAPHVASHIRLNTTK
jgi:hypothetical protein